MRIESVTSLRRRRARLVRTLAKMERDKPPHPAIEWYRLEIAMLDWRIAARRRLRKDHTI